MSKEKTEKNLTIAEQEIVNHIRRWPTLYRSAHSVFHSAIISGVGSFKWKNGLLFSEDKQYKIIKGKARYFPYPFQISEEFAKNLLNNNANGFISVNPRAGVPITEIPNDIHPDWIRFISFHLFLDSKVTPELYDIIVQAHTIRHYGVTHNPHASGDHYRYEWAKYFERIPSYQAHLRLIEETREQGRIPPNRYLGIDI